MKTEIKENRKPIYWGHEDAETLSHEDMGECIEYMLEYMLDGESNPLPEEIDVYGYARSILPDTDKLAEGVLESIIESLDEQYGDPDYSDQSKQAMDKMLLAAKLFVGVVKDNYIPWKCDQVCIETINVKKWVLEHAPEWNVTFEEDEK